MLKTTYAASRDPAAPGNKERLPLILVHVLGVLTSVRHLHESDVCC